MSCLDVFVGGASDSAISFVPGSNEVLFTAKKREYGAGLSLFRSSPWARRWFRLRWGGEDGTGSAGVPDAPVLCVMHKPDGEVKQRFPLHNAVVRVPGEETAAVPHLLEVGVPALRLGPMSLRCRSLPPSGCSHPASALALPPPTPHPPRLGSRVWVRYTGPGCPPGSLPYPSGNSRYARTVNSHFQVFPGEELPRAGRAKAVPWPDDPPRPLLLAMDTLLGRLQVLAVLVAAAGAGAEEAAAHVSTLLSPGAGGGGRASATSPASSPEPSGALSPSTPTRIAFSPGSRAARYSIRTQVCGQGREHGMLRPPPFHPHPLCIPAHLPPPHVSWPALCTIDAYYIFLVMDAQTRLEVVASALGDVRELVEASLASLSSLPLPLPLPSAPTQARGGTRASGAPVPSGAGAGAGAGAGDVVGLPPAKRATGGSDGDGGSPRGAGGHAVGGGAGVGAGVRGDGGPVAGDVGSVLHHGVAGTTVPPTLPSTFLPSSFPQSVSPGVGSDRPEDPHTAPPRTGEVSLGATGTTWGPVTRNASAGTAGSGGAPAWSPAAAALKDEAMRVEALSQESSSGMDLWLLGPESGGGDDGAPPLPPLPPQAPRTLGADVLAAARDATDGLAGAVAATEEFISGTVVETLVSSLLEVAERLPLVASIATLFKVWREGGGGGGSGRAEGPCLSLCGWGCGHRVAPTQVPCLHDAPCPPPHTSTVHSHNLQAVSGLSRLCSDICSPGT
jgi:hypothetical protein